MDEYCQTENDSISSTDTGMSLKTASFGQVLFRSILVVVALCGLVENGIVIWLVHWSIRRNSFSVYTLNLAIADFVHLSFQILFSMRQILKSFLSYCFPLLGIFMVLRFFSYFAGLGIMTAISFQRCLSVLCPIWYRCHCPKHVPAVVSAILWLLTLLLNLLRGHACGQLRSTDTTSCRALVITTAVYTSLLFSIMGLASLLLLCRVQSSSRGHRVVLLSALGFFLCGVPLAVLRILLYEVKNESLNDISVLLSCVNSTANPTIYLLIGSLERQWPCVFLKVLLQRGLDEVDDKHEKGTPAGRTEEVQL